MANNWREIYGIGAAMVGAGMIFCNALTSFDSPYMQKSVRAVYTIDKNNHMERRLSKIYNMTELGAFLIAKGVVYGATWPVAAPIMLYHATQNTSDFSNHFVLGSKYTEMNDVSNEVGRVFENCFGK